MESTDKKYTIDLHGYTCEQARAKVQDTIDKCFYHGYNVVRIIYGVGTGKLESVVYDEALNHQLVKSIGANIGEVGYLDLILEERS